MLANVLVDLGRQSLDRLFTYRVPRALGEQTIAGARVLVPFARRRAQGWVIELPKRSPVRQLKELAEILAPAPAFWPQALELARWIADYYCCSLVEALRPMLPPIGQGLSRALRLTDAATDDLDLPEPSATVFRLLREAGGQLSLEALQRRAAGCELGQAQIRPALSWLRRRKLVQACHTIRPPGARPKAVTTLELAVSEEDGRAAVERLRSRTQTARQAAALEAMLNGAAGLTVGGMAAQAGVTPASVRALVRVGLLRCRTTEVRRDPWEALSTLPPTELTLTPDQQAALQPLLEAVTLPRHEVFVLYGVTASGKTEVFLRAIETALANGRQAIALLPEISLTAQAMAVFRGRFGDRVALLHSKLSPGERYDEWRRLESGEAQVALGARSAIFAPLPRVGLIVLDEEHEPSYKQDQSPRYHAREVAIRCGELSSCPVVLASATPSLETFHRAQSGRYRLLTLPERIDGRPMPEVETVDLRGRERRGIFTDQLSAAVERKLSEQEQVILFLNRRAYATFLLCPECGHRFQCPLCQIALRYHRREAKLRCHHCDYTLPAPTTCPGCNSTAIRQRGFGTERVEEEIQSAFGQARVSRLDRDTTARKGAHLRIVSEFREFSTDLLVGTQMVAKGFDFPGVTLVGVVSADTALNLPDFRAAERTFQLLTQAAGRSGRRDRPGQVIVQTHCPDHYAIQAASRHDYLSFYEQELEMRREPAYPPFARLANVIASAPEEEQARQAVEGFGEACAQALAQSAAPVELIGPAPAPWAKLKGRFRWHLLLRAPEHEPLRRVIQAARERWRPSPKVVLAIDIDPVSLM